jgi:hypothetical protein
MSGARRWLLPYFGYSGYDPFLLVSPFIVGLTFANLLLRRLIPRDSAISKLIYWLLIVMAVQILNPLQGGIMVGLGGALFYIVPVLWFYIGRMHCSEAAFGKLAQWAVVVAALAGAYGLYQTYFGLLPSELDYERYSGFVQYVVAGSARVYATFVGLGAVLCMANVLWRRPLFIFVMAALCVAVFLTSIRGAVVGVLLASCVLWAIQGRTMWQWLPRLGLAVVVAAIGLTWSLHQAQGTLSGSGNTEANAMITHQVQGLSDPLHSTATGHVTMQVAGVLYGLTHPWGNGLGSTTLAAFKYSATQNLGSEGDFGNMFGSLGVIGGFIYIALVWVVVRDGAKNWLALRSFPALASLAILAATLGSWLSGGNYTEMILVWCAIGYIDRATVERRARELAAQDDASAAGAAGDGSGVKEPRKLAWHAEGY